jgi:hypothetical protein
MNQIEYENSIKVFIEELNTCLLKFKESSNGDLYPVICRRWDIKQMNDLAKLDINQKDFIQLSDGQVLGIKDFTKSPQIFLNLSHFENKVSVNC